MIREEILTQMRAKIAARKALEATLGYRIRRAGRRLVNNLGRATCAIIGHGHEVQRHEGSVCNRCNRWFDCYIAFPGELGMGPDFWALADDQARAAKFQRENPGA
ncbi:MAG: hypothetical protein V4597_19370 [Pseudomonadota bacterium]